MTEQTETPPQAAPRKASESRSPVVPATPLPAAAAPSAITVDIYDQTYRLHGDDAEYVRRLAQIVDSKMRAVAAQGKTVDSLRVAVLAALNVADELVALQEKHRNLTGTTEAAHENLRTRTHSLTGLIDSLLNTGS